MKTSRRSFLAAAGLGALAVPLLRAGESRGAPANFPRRLVVFATPNGGYMDSIWSDSVDALGPALAPLAPLKSKLVVARGVDHKSALKGPVPKDHFPDNYNLLIARQPLGGPDTFSPGGISIDQHIAAVVGTNTKYKSQHSGVQSGGYCGIISSLGPSQPVPPENDPFKVYQRFFDDFTKEPGELERIRNEKKSVLDAVAGDLGALSCRLGAEDREKLGVHLESIRDIEKQFDFPTALDDCTVPEPTDPFDVRAPANYPRAGKLHMDLLVAGIACDLTRVCTLQWRNGNGDPLVYEWLDSVPYTQHDIAHSNVAITPAQQAEMLTKIDRWYAEQLFHLASRLDAIPEGDGTVLDNTALVWVHEQADPRNHSRVDHPYVIVGGCGGAIRTGRTIDFGGKSHSGLLMALANAMGVPTDSFGDEDFSEGPIDLSS